MNSSMRALRGTASGRRVFRDEIPPEDETTVISPPGLRPVLRVKTLDLNLIDWLDPCKAAGQLLDYFYTREELINFTPSGRVATNVQNKKKYVKKEAIPPGDINSISWFTVERYCQLIPTKVFYDKVIRQECTLTIQKVSAALKRKVENTKK